MNSIFITGTDTEVGKTAAAALTALLYQRAGCEKLGYLKAAQSGAELNDGALISQDASLVKAAGVASDNVVCSYLFAAELSPFLAARRAGVEISLNKIVADYQRLASRLEAVIVEGAGGLLTPLTEKEYFIDLAVKLDLPLLIVVRPGLGTLNHTLMTVRSARRRGLDVAGLIINNYPEDPNEAEKTNVSELRRITGAPVILRVPRLRTSDNIINSLKKIVAGLDHKKILPLLKKKKEDTRLLAELDVKYIWHPFTQLKEYERESPPPPIIEKGDGVYLIDTEGRRYIDGVSSLWVNVHGHRQPRLDEAVRRQLGKISHSTLLGVTNVPAVRLAAKLTALAPGRMAKVFYSDSGSTAVEIALKIAFQYWRQSNGGQRRDKFISFRNAYHGDTLGSVSVGGIDLFHQKYQPLLFEVYKADSAYCYRCPVGKRYPGCGYDCLGKLEELLAEHRERLAALIIEPKVQGAAGMLISPPGYLRRVRQLADEYGILMIADEVAVGFGRTGKMFACQLEGVEPDIICLAKGITGGYLPLAATLTTERIHQAFYGDYEQLRTFFHGHTYTGNPLACRAALANIELFQELNVLKGLEDKVSFLSDKLADFKDLPAVGDVRSCGMMVGIELVRNKSTKEPFPPASRVGHQVILRARELGAIIRPLGDVIVLMPPLGIAEEELGRLLEITKQSILEVVKEIGGNELS